MSLFEPATVICPACRAPVDFDLNRSLFADRRPDLRAEVLAGIFQQEICPDCGATFRPDPNMTYLDTANRQWILVEPLANRGAWRGLEKSALDAFAGAYGPEAAPAVVELGQTLQVRVVFGWMALREKLVLRDHALDDVTLELLKLQLLRTLDGQPLSDDAELRLIEVDGDRLELAWVAGPAEELLEGMQIPREAYDKIALDAEDWRELHQELSAGPFVDMNRLLVPGDEEPPTPEF